MSVESGITREYGDADRPQRNAARSGRALGEPVKNDLKDGKPSAAWLELCRWLLIDDDDAAIVASKAGRQERPRKPIESEERHG